MRKLIIIVVLCSVMALFYAGCSRKGGAALNAIPTSEQQNTVGSEIRSMVDLRRLLMPGTLTNEVILKLGKPHYIEYISEGSMTWNYDFRPFPADGDMLGSYVTGVIIGITNGHLSKWGCSYTGSNISVQRDLLPNDKSAIHENRNSSADSSMGLFVVSKDPFTNSLFIDTELFPKLGFIPPTPNLKIKKIKEILLTEHVNTNSPNNSHNHWSIGITLHPAEAAKLEDITKGNISKKLLITLNGQLISCPHIVAPLITGSFSIDCKEHRLMEDIKTNLENMVK